MHASPMQRDLPPQSGIIIDFGKNWQLEPLAADEQTYTHPSTNHGPLSNRRSASSHLLSNEQLPPSPFSGANRVPRKPVPAIASHDSYRPLNPEERDEGYADEQAEKSARRGRAEEWPIGPQRLRQWTKMVYVMFCWDIILTLTPVAFFVFAICALSLHKKPMSRFGSNIQEGSKLGPTIFPIIFAAIVGRLMRAAALKRAEQGSQLGLLEQLMGSQSLVAAIERTILLRRYGFLGVSIILLWLLSPLGGQSSLRILDITTSNITSRTPIHYFNVTTSLGYGSTAFQGSDALGTGGPVVAALLQATLLAPKDVTVSSVDPWNNVKIPRLDDMSPFRTRNPQNPWIAVNQTSAANWSALSGLVVLGLPSSGISNFTMESSYVELECANSVRYKARKSPHYYDYVFNTTGLQFHNVSNPFTAPLLTVPLPTPSSVNESTSFFVDEISPISWWYYPEYMDPTKSLKIVYGSDSASDLLSEAVMDLFRCDVGIARVESNVLCHGVNCAVHRMRRSNLDTRSPWAVPFNLEALGNLFLFLAFVTGVPHLDYTSPIDYYMLGSSAPLVASYGNPVYGASSSYTDVPGNVFSQRFARIFNTLWQTSMAPFGIPVGSQSTYADFTSSGAGLTNTTAVTELAVSVYDANYAFCCILLLITIVLQACAIGGLLLKYTTTAPDILGYISSMTRDNPHTLGPVGGNTLDGLDRARYLDDMRVQLGDTQPGEHEGHIAFCSVDKDADFEIGRLSKRKLYV